MIVVTRKRYEAVRANLDGRELVVSVSKIGQGWVRLAFDGAHRIQRFEVEPTARRPRTHLAGMPIVIGTYGLQRCTLCGEVLQEYDLDELQPGQCVPAGLAAGRFYEFHPDSDTILLPHPKTLRFESDQVLPPNCCIFGG